MNWTTRRRMSMAVVCVLALGAMSLHAQQQTFEDAIPERTVDPVIGPTVYQGGTVVLRVSVAADGTVKRIEVVKPFPALTDAVVDAVRRWRFKSARLNGRPVDATTTVTVYVALIRAVGPR